MQTPGWGEQLFEWLHFLNHAHEEGEDEMQTHYTNPAIQQAFRVLEKLSADEETRRRAEIRERALKDEASLLAEAREEGREEGIKKGELIGSIRTLQRILRRPLSEELTLREQNLDALQQMLQELETVLKDSPIMS